ncbi:MAG: ABC transporter permease subunit [bacterium]|nr:ABC transporter permease subunit [bacterium]
MNGVIFTETLRRGWRGMLWWGIGLGFLAWLNVIAVPNVESIQQIAGLLETMPPLMMQMFGVTDIQFMATPEGYLALQLFAFFPLVLAIYGGSVGMNIVANEEDRGILDMLLSAPVPRWRVLLEKALAYAVLIVGVVALLFAWVWAGLLMVPEIAAQIDMGELAVATFGMVPQTWIVMGAAALFTGLLRSRGLALGLVAAFVVGSYFLNTLGGAVTDSILATLRPLSYFSHLDSAAIFNGNVQWGALLLPALATAVGVGIGMIGFQRRDVGA